MSEEEILSLNQQLEKLDQISEKITKLISNNDFEQINHIDKLRKKIIVDVTKKNFVIDNHNKKSIMRLISRNDQMIISLQEKRTNILNNNPFVTAIPDDYYMNNLQESSFLIERCYGNSYGYDIALYQRISEQNRVEGKVNAPALGTQVRVFGSKYIRN